MDNGRCLVRVFVYYNLHRKCWSVKALEGDRKGKVIAHMDTVRLVDAEFKVSEAGRQRVLREQRKNVHAGVVGRLCTNVDRVLDEVGYNPYKWNSFVNKETGLSVYRGPGAYLNGGRVWLALTS